jgi:hypothetical protein
VLPTIGKMKSMKEPDPEVYPSKDIKRELQDIKKLLILNASKSGATSDEIGKVLGVGEVR